LPFIVASATAQARIKFRPGYLENLGHKGCSGLNLQADVTSNWKGQLINILPDHWKLIVEKERKVI
jgi:hypothetical protein